MAGNSRVRLAPAAGLSLLFTALFFIEYLPPIQRVHVPYDLLDYHYPLDDYLFQSVIHHRIPQWDPSDYCGMSFAGNPQVAEFYPPMWLVIAANRHQPWLRYSTLEILVFVHVWLAFVFCFLWLRGRGFADLACILGAGVFAYSGYMLLQLQHLGLVCAYAWFPFGLLGVDRAAAANTWRPPWRLALASAMCFLAGYPPMWFVFAVIAIVYSVLRRRPLKLLLAVLGALVFSLLLSMVQLAPALALSATRSMGPTYGAGSMRRLELWASYLIPNYFDFALTTPVLTNPGGEYLYLGPAALFGLFFLVKNKRIGRQIPLLGAALASLILVTNPLDLVWLAVKHFKLLSQVCRSWYFLSGITLAIAGLAAAGIDSFLGRPARRRLKRLAPFAAAAAIAWATYEIWVWLPGGPEFAPGWKGAWDVALALAIFCLLMTLIHSATGTRRLALAAVLLISVGADYKAFGTSKRVNAGLGNVDAARRGSRFPGMSDEAFGLLEQNRDFRIAVSENGPPPETLRERGLTTPQGRDPLASGQIRKLLGNADATRFSAIDPANHDLLRALAVRYFVTSEAEPEYQKLVHDAAFRKVPPEEYYYKVFEFLDARPVYRWEPEEPGQEARIVSWLPEQRTLEVSSPRGGRFVLVEQMFPGWTATVDGKAAPIERWNEAFQSVEAPPGAHIVAFRFRSAPLRIGAVISLLSALGLGWMIWSERRSSTM